MPRQPSFTMQKRERFLAYLERGSSVKESADAADISRQTVSAWVREGKALDDNSDKAAFARRYEAILAGSGPVELTRSDLVRMLEEKARAGNIGAMKLLLTKPWEAVRPPEKDEPKEQTFAEQLAAKRNVEKA